MTRRAGCDKRERARLRIALVLGALIPLIALGPLTIDLYLPSVPGSSPTWRTTARHRGDAAVMPR